RDAGTPVVLDVKLLGRVIAVEQKAVSVGDASKSEQPEGAIVRDAWRQQDERVNAAAVDGQIENLSRIDYAGHIRLAVINKLRGAVYLDFSGRLANRQCDIETKILPDLKRQILCIVFSESRSGHRDRVAGAWSQRWRGKESGIISSEVARNSE